MDAPPAGAIRYLQKVPILHDHLHSGAFGEGYLQSVVDVDDLLQLDGEVILVRARADVHHDRRSDRDRRHEDRGEEQVLGSARRRLERTPAGRMGGRAKPGKGLGQDWDRIG